jgi:hypothetical protein
MPKQSLVSIFLEDFLKQKLNNSYIPVRNKPIVQIVHRLPIKSINIIFVPETFR